MKSKSTRKVSTGSMADIAFLLLVFWLMTTSLSEEQGILRLLPSIDETEISKEVHERNVLRVLVNKDNDILMEGEAIQVNEIKAMARAFLVNSGVFKNEKANPQFTERKWLKRDRLLEKIKRLEQRIKVNESLSNTSEQDTLNNLLEKKLALDYFGEFKILRSDAIISIQNDKQTSYDQYIKVQNELTSAINELRDELCLKHFGTLFSELDSEEERSKIIAVRQVYPQRISEAEFKK